MEGSQIILSGLSLEQFQSLIGSIVSDRVSQEINKLKQQELQEKFLSPAEVCKLFSPKISRQTLSNWTKKGLIRKTVIGHSAWYRYTDVMECMKSLKVYERSL